MTTEDPKKDEGEATPAEKRFGGSWKMLIPFVILPVTIVGVSVGIFLLFGMLADTHKGAKDYLYELQSGSEHQRWQAAFELSRYLSSQDFEDEDAYFEKELLRILKTAGRDEVQLRTYLIIALAQIGSDMSLDTLIAFADKGEGSETQIYAIWALGRIGSPKAADTILKKINSDDAGIRKTAAFSLGFVGNKSHVKVLKKLLDDSVQDVRWNAALGLAQLGSSSGDGILLKLLDPIHVKNATPNLRERERTEIVLSALNAVGMLRLKSARKAVVAVSKSATDSRLRLTAHNVSRLLGESAP